MRYSNFVPGWVLAAMLAAALAATGPAVAGTVIADQAGSDPAAGSVIRTILAGPGAPQIQASLTVERFDMLRTGGTDPNVFLGSGVANHFLAFCIEPRQFIASGVTYDVGTVAQAATNLGGIGLTKAALIEELFGRYAPNLAAPMSQLLASALQIAIWEIVRELPDNPLDVTAGNIFFETPENPSGIIALAQSFVQSLDGTGPMAVGLMVILNGINGDPSTDAGTQDLLVQVAVAEPASLAMLGLGLAGLGAARRRPRVRANA